MKAESAELSNINHHRRESWLAGFILATLFLCAGTGTAAPPDATAPAMGYAVVAEYPHSTSSFTEGFFYLDGLFYEGTGMPSHSQLLAIQPETGKVVRSFDLPSQYFGEGIVDWGDKIYEWTWTSHIGFIYDRATFKPVGHFEYAGEGWGMTHTSTELVTSDGTATLRFRNPATFEETRNIIVRDGETPISQLNELEWVHGSIYANLWHSDLIARIDPADGHVLAWIDLSGLLPATERTNPEAVLNGIAYDAEHDRLFVTGKLWPKVFEIKVVPALEATIRR
jgi:glutamine cyclotransferase